MLQSFFDRERFNEPVDSRVFDAFVEVKKISFVVVVLIQSFQTGSISKKRRSGQATENEDDMFASKVVEADFVS